GPPRSNFASGHSAASPSPPLKPPPISPPRAWPPRVLSRALSLGRAAPRRAAARAGRGTLRSGACKGDPLSARAAGNRRQNDAAACCHGAGRCACKALLEGASRRQVSRGVPRDLRPCGHEPRGHQEAGRAARRPLRARRRPLGGRPGGGRAGRRPRGAAAGRRRGGEVARPPGEQGCGPEGLGGHLLALLRQSVSRALGAVRQRLQAAGHCVPARALMWKPGATVYFCPVQRIKVCLLAADLGSWGVL
ncbi:unnamed protein product, partial [Prorocentrum cordatum]